MTHGSPLPLQLPFSAVVGQDEAKLALLLTAVDPRIGGVLLRGEKGTRQIHPGPGTGGVPARVGAVRGAAHRGHRGPGGGDPRPDRGLHRRRAAVLARAAGGRRRRGAVRRRDQPAAGSSGRRAARRGGQRDQPGGARGCLPRPRQPLPARRFHEPRGGRPAAPAARPLRAGGGHPFRRPTRPSGRRPCAAGWRSTRTRLRSWRRRPPRRPRWPGDCRRPDRPVCRRGWWRRCRRCVWPWAPRGCAPT